MLAPIELQTALARVGAGGPFKIHLDFETFSEYDLKNGGGYNYSRHPTTRVNCYAVAVRFADNNYHLESWNPSRPHPQWFIDLLQTGCAVAAFNWFFEYNIWHNVLRREYPQLPEIHYSRFDCTAARARANSIGRSLDTVAQAMRLDHQKNVVGYRVMMQLCKPKKPSKKDPHTYYLPELHAQKYDILEQYCREDVLAEMAVDAALPPWRPEEFAVFQIDKKINLRGIPIDVDLCKRALQVVQQAKIKYNTELHKITGLSSASEVKQLTEWLAAQGVKCDSLDAEECRELLYRADLPAHVLRAVKIREMLSKSSVAKINKMLTLAQYDGTAKDQLIYAGAIGTLRWAGGAMQPQNLPRGRSKPARVLAAVESLKTGRLDVVETLHGDPVQTASDCIRALIAAPDGMQIMAADFSNIESRVLFYLADDQTGLQLYRDNKCIYSDMGATTYGVTYDQVVSEYKAGDGNKRQMGKAAILGLGYQMAEVKFLATIEKQQLTYDPVLGDFTELRGRSMRQWRAARISELERCGVEYGATKITGPYATMPNGVAVMLADSAEASLYAMQTAQTDKIKNDYRDKFTAVPRFWNAANKCAIRAVENPGEYVPLADGLTHFGQMFFYMRGDWLCLDYPGGGFLSWYRPIIKNVLNQFGTWQNQLFYETLDSVKHKWTVTNTYGGKLVENIVQSYSRRLLCHAMLKADAAGYDIFMHVHDELVAVVKGGASVDDFCNLICELPAWAHGLPIKASGWIGQRFKKD